MRKSLTACALALALTTSACKPAAQNGAPTDLKGHWAGTSESIVRGSAMHHAAQAGNNPLLDNVQFDFNVVGQDGRRFWGTVTSKTGQEPLIGVIAFDGKTIIAEDTDGTVQGRMVDADTIDIVYYHTGTSTVVAANRMKRQK
jgi:hypothetical protein